MNWIVGLVPALIMGLTPDGRAQGEPNSASTSAREATKATVPEPTQPVPALTTRIAWPELISPPAGVWLDTTKDRRLPFRMQLSYWTSEIVKLAQAGIEDSVVLAFLDDVGTFNLGADEIIYLSDLGVSSQVITAMLQHDFEFAAGNRPATAWVTPSSPPAVHLVFTANTNAPATVARPAAAAPSAVISDHGGLADLTSPYEFPEFDYPQATAPAEPAQKPKLYAVREPFPEKITDPILVFRSAGMTPNVQVLEPFP